MKVSMICMKMAESIRKEVQGYNKLIINPDKSRYNTDVYMTDCMICKAPAIDMHHIQYQCESDNEGFFKDFHKNTKHNLIPLCKDCHMKEHNGEISIKGYKKSSAGVIVDVESRNINPSPKENIEEVCQVVGCIVDEQVLQQDCEKIFQYLKRGRCNWYMRNAKTHMFKKCSDENRVLQKMNKVLNKSFTTIPDILSNYLYDPSI